MRSLSRDLWVLQDVLRRRQQEELEKCAIKIDELVGQDPYDFVAFVVLLGLIIYIFNAACVRLFFGRIHKAEEQRSSEKSVRFFLHRCFLMGSLVHSLDLSSAKGYSFFRPWVSYLFAVGVFFLLHRILHFADYRLEHALLGVGDHHSSDGNSKAYDNKKEEGRLRQQRRPPSVWLLFFLLSFNVVTLDALVHVLFFSSSASVYSGVYQRGIAYHLHPLFLYDAVHFILCSLMIGLKYLVLKREEAEEAEAAAREAAFINATVPGGGAAQDESQQPTPTSPASAADDESADLLLWYIGTVDRVVQYATFFLSFTLAVVNLTQHVHFWSLKILRLTPADVIFSFMLMRCLRRVFIVPRAFLTSLSLANIIDVCFSSATPQDLARLTLDEICSICLKSYRRGRVKKLPCQHLIHAHCLLQCLEKCSSSGNSGAGLGGRAAAQVHQLQIRGARCPLCRCFLFGYNRKEADEIAERRRQQQQQQQQPPEQQDQQQRFSILGAAFRTINENGWTRTAGANTQREVVGTAPPSSLPPVVAAAERREGHGPGRDRAAAFLPHQQTAQDEHEHPLFRISTDDLRAWLPIPLPIPSFSLEVIRRGTRPHAAEAAPPTPSSTPASGQEVEAPTAGRTTEANLPLSASSDQQEDARASENNNGENDATTGTTDISSSGRWWLPFF